MKRVLIIFFASLSISLTTYAQESKPSTNGIVYKYQILIPKAKKTQISTLKQIVPIIQKMVDVKDVVLNTSGEYANKPELIIKVAENQTVKAESDKRFSIVDVKQEIIKQGFIPGELFEYIQK